MLQKARHSQSPVGQRIRGQEVDASPPLIFYGVTADTPIRMRTVVDEDGGLVGIVTQSDLLHAMIADMEEASRLKSDVLAVISHELRTPIAIVAGYVELLMDGTFEPLMPAQQDVVAHIQHASSQLVDLVNTAFELTQLEAGRVSVTRRLIDVGMLW